MILPPVKVKNRVFPPPARSKPPSKLYNLASVVNLDFPSSSVC